MANEEDLAGALTGGAGGGGDGGGAGGGSDAGGGADGGGTGGADGGGDGGFGAGADGPDWLEKLSVEGGDAENPSNRDWAKAKGFKDLDSVVKSLRETERAFRSGGKITVPGDGAKPEEVAAFRTAIGVPDKPDGYEIKPIANGSFDPNRAEGPDNPKNLPLNEPLIAALRESAVKHGAPKGAFEGLVGDFIQAQLDEAAAETKKQDELAAGWVKEQGGKKDEQLAHVTTAMRALGISRADGQALRGALGADRALGLLAKIGGGMAEDVMLTGGKGRFSVGGAEAQAELDRLKADPEFSKKNVPGSAERVRWDRLNRTAAEYRAAKDEAG